MFDAKTALELGIVNRVVPADKLMDEAKAFAMSIVNGLRMAKPCVEAGLVRQRARGADEGARVYEVEEQIRCFESEDCAEGLRAFFEKRKPNFQGK